MVTGLAIISVLIVPICSAKVDTINSQTQNSQVYERTKRTYPNTRQILPRRWTLPQFLQPSQPPVVRRSRSAWFRPQLERVKKSNPESWAEYFLDLPISLTVPAELFTTPTPAPAYGEWQNLYFHSLTESERNNYSPMIPNAAIGSPFKAAFAVEIRERKSEIQTQFMIKATLTDSIQVECQMAQPSHWAVFVLNPLTVAVVISNQIHQFMSTALPKPLPAFATISASFWRCWIAAFPEWKKACNFDIQSFSARFLQSSQVFGDIGWVDF